MGIATQERATKLIDALLTPYTNDERKQYEKYDIYSYDNNSQASGKSGIYINNKKGLYEILEGKKFTESMGVVYAEDIYMIDYDGTENYISSEAGTNENLYDSNKNKRRIITYTET